MRVSEVALKPMKIDSRIFQRFEVPPHWPLLFAGDVALKRDLPEYPFAALKVASWLDCHRRPEY